MRIGIVAVSSRFDTGIIDDVCAVAPPDMELVFHPNCVAVDGHFAGSDAERLTALLDFANDPAFDAIWFGRGGYGACRIAEEALAAMGPAAHDKLYMGYSDAGYLLAGLYRDKIGQVAHGPMPADITRSGGTAALARAFDWFRNPVPTPGPPQAAFNLTVFGHIVGTPLKPDLTGHVLMLEDVSEHLYRIDRNFHAITANPHVRRVAGIKLGRVSQIPENDPPFGKTAEEICRFWCDKSGIAYLGRADIGHDAANTVVPFG